MSLPRIGWIGTGIMGRYMCEHCMKAGYKATVFSRTLSKCKPLEQIGATVASSPREVAENSDIVFSIVGYPSDVREIALGDNGVISGLSKNGGIYVDMTTSEPSLAKKIWERGREKSGVFVLDAPVSGGDVGARNATLSIMCGGESEAFSRVLPLFQSMGKNIRLMGPSGSGQHTKMANQVVIAGNMVGVVEGMLYAHKAGLDIDEVLSILGAGAASSFSLTALGPRIAQRNFDPGFIVDHFVKDMGIALTEAKQMGISLPGLGLVNQLYVALQAQGGGRLGTHALINCLERLNGIDTDTIRYRRSFEKR